MDLKTHNEKFQEIIQKYNLNQEEKAAEIAKFLTTRKENETITPKEFGTLFLMEEKDAEIFLSWIQKGLEFKNKTK